MVDWRLILLGFVLGIFFDYIMGLISYGFWKAKFQRLEEKRKNGEW